MLKIEKLLENFENTLLKSELGENLALIKEIFKKDDILRIREIETGGSQPIRAAVFFMDSMINTLVLNESIIKPLLLCENNGQRESIANFVTERVLFAAEVKTHNTLAPLLRNLLYGDTIVLFEGSTEGLSINTKGWRTRGISEPENERVLQGPREGFEEAVMLNVALLRRRLPTPDFCVETLTVGRRTDTGVFICYLDSVVNKTALCALKKKLKSIDIDGVLDSNYINELINEHPRSLLKTVGSTERPDVAVARILEGRIAVMVDGTPVVLTLPYLFSENFQADDDYYTNHFLGTLGRMLRYLCFILAISVPAVFLSLITHHTDLLPTSFLISVCSARNSVPLSSLVECVLLILIFEILKETGLRMPQGVGHALSIVGGLVVGQAAVEARIVSAPMLIIIALSGIAGLMLPRLRGIIFFSRLGLVILSHYLGLLGFFAGIAALLIHILSLSSFSVDYTSSIINPKLQSLKDTLIRTSWRNMITRPVGLSQNKIRKGKK